MELNKKEIYALYNDETIRVYQAYKDKIAHEAVELQTFGKHFKLERMTWIKPSFLWMMYRSGWAMKEGQENILAIDIKRAGFDEILSNVVLSSFNSDIYSSYGDWKEKISQSEVRCQWDPERDIYGNPIDRRSIQLGIKGEKVLKYINEWIVKITDITPDVIKWRKQIKDKTFNNDVLPNELRYSISQSNRKVLGIIS